MALEISSIKNAELHEIAKSVDKNGDGELKRSEYSVFAKTAQEKGIDYKEIYEALDMNGFQRWWNDVDKISTDGEDDGRLSFKEGATSFVKGLLGGIPKAMVKHPIASALTIGVCAAAAIITEGAISPVLCAVGLVFGVGMVGVGTYKAITAKKDGDAKQALETMGMGVTTTAMSMLSAGKALNSAEKAGVKSAHVAEDANIFQKSVQTFKATPEALKMSKEWSISYIKGTPINLEFVDGSKQTKFKGELTEETLADGTYKEYTKGALTKETLPDGTLKEYTKYGYKETFTDGSYKIYNKEGNLVNGELADGTILKSCVDYNGVKGRYIKMTSKDGTYQVINEKTGILFEEKLADGTVNTYYSKYYGLEGHLKVTTLNDGKTIVIDNNTGNIIEGTIVKGDKTIVYRRNGLLEEISADGTSKFYNDGKLIQELPSAGGYRNYDEKGNIVSELLVDKNRKAYYENGNLIEETFTDGTYTKYNSDGSITAQKLSDGSYIQNYSEYNSVEGDFTKTTLKDGSFKVLDNKTGNVIQEVKNVNGSLKETLADGTIRKYDSSGDIIEEIYTDGSRSKFDGFGNIKESISKDGRHYEKLWEWNGKEGSYEKITFKDGSWQIRNNSYSGRIVEETLSDGTYIKYNTYGNITDKVLPNGKVVVSSKWSSAWSDPGEYSYKGPMFIGFIPMWCNW